MQKDFILYHGSQQIVEIPKYGVGKKYNDYGQGFYCTENVELAKEWACPIKKDGYANKYKLYMDDLRVMHLTKDNYNILNWIAVLLANRNFDITSPVAYNAREYLLEHYLPDLTGVDVLVGYRADDSYFSFAEDFLNNGLSLRDLNYAMQLERLGEQVVLISERSFSQLEFQGYEIADYREYYFKRLQRDQSAREDYASRKKTLEQMKDDIFVFNIMMEGIKKDDPRLQSTIFE